MRLSYNKEIFTKVNKWDSNFVYTGIKINEKLNQRNGQDYKLIDAIDIDWNGMWVKFANAYVYNTEDLLFALSYLDQSDRYLVLNSRLSKIESEYVGKDSLVDMQHILEPGAYIKIDNSSYTISAYGVATLSYVTTSFPTFSYIDEWTYTKASTAQAIDDRISEILGNADASFDTLKEISEWIMNHSEYIETNYNDVDFSSGDRYYIFENGKYIEIDEAYYNENPSSQYYVLKPIEKEIVDLSNRVESLETTVGQATPGPNNTTTYTGILKDLNDLHITDSIMQSTINYISGQLTTVSSLVNTANENANAAKETAETALDKVHEIKEEIGYSLVPGYYSSITKEEAASLTAKGIPVYIKDIDGSYVEHDFGFIYTYDWYAYNSPVLPTGMHKEIYDLSQWQMSMQHINVDNTNSMPFIQLSTDESNTIFMNSSEAIVSFNDGTISKNGLTTGSLVSNMIGYVVEWIDI